MSEEQFLHACEWGDMDVIDDLIDKVDINCVNDVGMTGLMLAVYRPYYKEGDWVPNLDVVSKLLAKGADVDIESEYSLNCLDYVLITVPFNIQLASLFLVCSKHGINYVNNNRTYLDACESMEAYRFCVDSGIDIVPRNYDEMTTIDRLDHYIDALDMTDQAQQYDNSVEANDPNYGLRLIEQNKNYLSIVARNYLVSLGAKRSSEL